MKYCFDIDLDIPVLKPDINLASIKNYHNKFTVTEYVNPELVKFFKQRKRSTRASCVLISGRQFQDKASHDIGVLIQSQESHPIATVLKSFLTKFRDRLVKNPNQIQGQR